MPRLTQDSVQLMGAGHWNGAVPMESGNTSASLTVNSTSYTMSLSRLLVGRNSQIVAADSRCSVGLRG